MQTLILKAIWEADQLEIFNIADTVIVDGNANELAKLAQFTSANPANKNVITVKHLNVFLVEQLPLEGSAFFNVFVELSNPLILKHDITTLEGINKMLLAISECVNVWDV